MTLQIRFSALPIGSCHNEDDWGKWRDVEPGDHIGLIGARTAQVREKPLIENAKFGQMLRVAREFAYQDIVVESGAAVVFLTFRAPLNEARVIGEGWATPIWVRSEHLEFVEE